MKNFDLRTLPHHVAIIMDGNGRWASQRHLPRTEGHRRGARALKSIVKASRRFGIRYLTVYAFSTENWKRPKGEVNALLALLRTYLLHETAELRENGVRLRVIGKRNQLPSKLLSQIEHSEEFTASETDLDLILAISYSGHQELADAVTRIINANAPASSVTAQTIEQMLYAPDVPAPDLLIRTGGEIRISNFLLWQIAYTELCFTEVFWPDFTEEVFKQCLQDFSTRERRFGKCNEKNF